MQPFISIQTQWKQQKVDSCLLFKSWKDPNNAIWKGLGDLGNPNDMDPFSEFFNNIGVILVKHLLDASPIKHHLPRLGAMAEASNSRHNSLNKPTVC